MDERRRFCLLGSLSEMAVLGVSAKCSPFAILLLSMFAAVRVWRELGKAKLTSYMGGAGTNAAPTVAVIGADMECS